ncbi:hypothetical protein GCM10022276_19900 [Sphingomonas limnosediminicola]|uniref:Uncharacterized protein n=1 Tax=Sphingomonas limnosediminicola TaxID=940133 RepID=A0ABP7LHM8_9SPHN
MAGSALSAWDTNRLSGALRDELTIRGGCRLAEIALTGQIAIRFVDRLQQLREAWCFFVWPDATERRAQQLNVVLRQEANRNDTLGDHESSKWDAAPRCRWAARREQARAGGKKLAR